MSKKQPATTAISDEASVKVVGLSTDESSDDTLRRQLENAQKKESTDPGKPKEKPDMAPVPSKQYKSSLYIVWNVETGGIIAIWTNSPPPQLIQGHIRVWEVQFSWTKPSWDQQTTYREACSEWNTAGQVSVVNRRKLHRTYLDNHLKKVVNLLDKNGDEIILEHDEEGHLTEACYNQILGMDTALIDLALSLYERDILLTSM